MKQYLDLLQHIWDNGVEKEDRTGTGTRSLFGYQMRFDLNKGLPLVTTKKMFVKACIYELLWFLRGDTNIRWLNDYGVHIWDPWADESGDLGPIYGQQWVRWKDYDGGTINQIAQAEDLIRNNPDSRRIIISGWNVADLQTLIMGVKTAPPPCHTIFQFYVVNNKLSCQLYQRSADVFIGVPFNTFEYALFTMMMAQTTGRELGEFIHTFGDVHIYKNHYEQVQLQLSRKPLPLPKMEINSSIKSIFDFQYEDFDLINYQHRDAIKAQIAV